MPEEESDWQGRSTGNVAATLNFSDGLAHSRVSDITQNIDIEAWIRVNQADECQALEKLAEAKKTISWHCFRISNQDLCILVLKYNRCSWKGKDLEMKKKRKQVSTMKIRLARKD
jgi:hypothetical protein